MSGVRSRNRAFSITYNGKRANSFYGLADRVGQAVSRFGTAESRAKSSLKRRVQPAASRLVREHYNVTAAKLRGGMRLAEGTHRDGDYLALWASSRRLSLIDFGGRWGGRRTPGATAEVVRGQRRTFPGTFIATVKGRKAIRARTFQDGRRAPRGPLTMYRGPSIFEMLSPSETPGSYQQASLKIRRDLITQLTDFYVAELRRQFKLSVGRK